LFNKSKRQDPSKEPEPFFNLPDLYEILGYFVKIHNYFLPIEVKTSIKNVESQLDTQLAEYAETVNKMSKTDNYPNPSNNQSGITAKDSVEKSNQIYTESCKRLISHEKYIAYLETSKDKSIIFNLIWFFEKIVRQKFMKSGNQLKLNNEFIYQFCLNLGEMLQVINDYEFKAIKINDKIAFATTVFLISRLFENLVSMLYLISNATTLVASFETKVYKRLHQVMQFILKGIS